MINGVQSIDVRHYLCLTTSKHHTLFTYLAEEFPDKPLTVIYALALHLLKEWAYCSYETLALGTHEETGSTNDFQPTGSGDCPGSTLVKDYFRCIDSFSQGNHLSFAAIEHDEKLRWYCRNRTHLNPGRQTDSFCAWTREIIRYFVPYSLGDEEVLHNLCEQSQRVNTRASE